jgi:hypothetical protein
MSKIRYGGTISDSSVLNYLTHLRNENLKIMFYPMLFMDIENKPWRGYLTGTVADIPQFFTRYNNFILHYANLVKDKVDGFLIGSELRDLTKITDGNGNFPAVDELVNLVGQVRQILGASVKIGYAADWSEYHHTDGGWYNLDKLWGCPDIDFVGIDAYFPLTNKVEELITVDDIKDGWQNYNDQPAYDWRNIQWWWNNRHTNPDGQQTDWIPQSKKIWFTEYGFASVDGTTNEPNKFYDPDSVDGGFPLLSQGKMDIFAQRKGIQATFEFWKNSPIVERKFLYCWDARPYPYFPTKMDVWADGDHWYYGHWVNGKLGALVFSNMFRLLLVDAGIDLSVLGEIKLDEIIDGFVLNNIISVNEVLATLQKSLFFDYYEGDGKLNIVARNKGLSTTIKQGELVALDKGIWYRTSILGDLVYRIHLDYLSKSLNYEISNTYAEKLGQNTKKVAYDNIPFVISDFRAKMVADKMLTTLWHERTIYEICLPPEYLWLKPSDMLLLDGILLRIVEATINENYTLTLRAVRTTADMYKYEAEAEKIPTAELLSNDKTTNMEIFTLQHRPNEVFFATSGNTADWNGCKIYYAPVDGENYKLLATNRVNAVVGDVIEASDDEFCVLLPSFVRVDELLEYGNLALAGQEVVKFQTAERQEDGSVKFAGLTRNLYGTETYSEGRFIFLGVGIVSMEHENGENFKYITK